VIQEFLRPVNARGAFYRGIQAYTGEVLPAWQEADIVIMGLFDKKKGLFENSRSAWYSLGENPAGKNIKTVDLGDLVFDGSPEAIDSMVLPFLNELLNGLKGRLILFGDTRCITTSFFRSVARPMDVSVLSARIEWNPVFPDQEITFDWSQTGLDQIYIIGVQNYLLTGPEKKSAEKSHLHIIRLAEVKKEPLIFDLYMRSSRIIYFDLESTPNHYFDETFPYLTGFDMDDWSAASYFSGISPVNLITVMDFKGRRNTNLLRLAALNLWHKLWGEYNKLEDYPLISKEKLKKIVSGTERKIYYVNEFTGRCWEEDERGNLTPCLKKNLLN
jgi:hypothetical protein